MDREAPRSLLSHLVFAAIVALALWPILTGVGHVIRDSDSPRHGDARWAERALERLKTAPTPLARYYALGDAAHAKFELGRLEEAARLATELLVVAATRERDWNYGNAIFEGHTVLGRVKLIEGDVDGAVRELELSFRSPGSQRIRSRGPSMVLAHELLRAGQGERVAAIIEEGDELWPDGRDQIGNWVAAIRAGRDPDFGALESW